MRHGGEGGTQMKSANKSEKARITSRPGAYGWVVTIVVWLTGVAMPLNMLKVSILSPALMSSFNVGTDVMSSVMAMFYLVAAILAIPGGLIVQKIGYRTTFVISLICAIAGGVLGYVTQDIGLFILSRVVEGIGFGLVGTAAVPAISAWFPPSKRGVPLGIWSIYVTMAFLVGPRLFSGIYTNVGDYHPIWAICLIFNIVVLVALIILYREPSFEFDENNRVIDKKPSEGPKPMRFAQVLRNPAVWIVGIIFSAKRFLSSACPTS